MLNRTRHGKSSLRLDKCKFKTDTDDASAMTTSDSRLPEGVNSTSVLNYQGSSVTAIMHNMYSQDVKTHHTGSQRETMVATFLRHLDILRIPIPLEV